MIPSTATVTHATGSTSSTSPRTQAITDSDLHPAAQALMLSGFVRAVHLFYVLMHCRVTECSKATSCFTGGNVIVMQLHRHPVGAAKVQQHVAFPDELDLQPWMHPESPDLTGNATCMYDLVSLIVHQGKASTSGHYVAVCRLGPAEGNCPPHANEGSPNLPQAVACSVYCLPCPHI